MYSYLMAVLQGWQYKPWSHTLSSSKLGSRGDPMNLHRRSTDKFGPFLLPYAISHSLTNSCDSPQPLYDIKSPSPAT